MADATFTTVVARVDQQLTNAIWEDQIRDNLNQLAGAHRNQLVNGGMEVWQRGAGPFTAGSAYSADRWQVNPGTGATSVTQETTTIDSLSSNSAKCVNTAGASQTPEFFQKVEHWAALKGQEISCSVRVNQGAASGLRVRIHDGVSFTDGATSATTGSWITLTCTKTMSASATTCVVYVATLVSGTYYIDNAMLTIGPDAAPYRPLHPQEELARCQRYYELHGGVNNAMGLNAYAAAGANYSAIIQFATAKYGVPTMTKNGTWGVVNSGQPATNAPTKDGYTLFATATALGTCSFGNNSTDDTITAEVNP